MINFDRLLALLEAGDDASLVRAAELLEAIMPDFGATLDPENTIAPDSQTFAIELSRLLGDDSPLSSTQKKQLQPFLNGLIESSSSKVSTIDQANEDLGSDSHVIDRELANRNFDDTLAITRFLAEGGLGKVWVAKDHAVQREIVLKQLRDNNAGDSTKDRFLHEAQVTAGLEHPNIVPVYGLNADTEGQPYYTMKYVRGDTFADMIHRHHEAFDSEKDINPLLDIFQHICNAVAYAHSRGIIHRDLKPENIAIGEFGEVLVLDWGLAKRLATTSSTALDDDPNTLKDQSRPGRVMGTPNYMAPEQARGASDEMDQRTDVYALGAILFEILTGRPPRFKGDRAKNIRTVLNDIQAGHIPHARELRPSVPKRLESICSKALDVSALQRYQTVEDLRDDVLAYRNYLPIRAHKESLTEKAKRVMARHRLVTSVILLASIIFAGGSLSYNVYENDAHNSAQLANEQIFSLSTHTTEKHAQTQEQLQLAENSRSTAATRLIAAERDKSKASFLSNAATEKRQQREAANRQAVKLAGQARKDEELSRLSLSKAARSAETEASSLSQAQKQFIQNSNVAFTDSINRINSTITKHFPTEQLFKQLENTKHLANILDQSADTYLPSKLFEYVTSEYAAILPELTRIATPGTIHSFATNPSGLIVAYTDNTLKEPKHRIGQITTNDSLTALPIVPDDAISKLYTYHRNTSVIRSQIDQDSYIQYWDLSSSQALSPQIAVPINAKLSIDTRHSLIVIAHINGAILYDTENGTRRSLKLSLNGDVIDASCDSNASSLCIASDEGSIYWLDLESKTIKRYRLPYVASHLSHHVDGSLYFTTEAGYLYRWREQQTPPEVLVRGSSRENSLTSLDTHLRHFCALHPRGSATIHNLSDGTSLNVLPLLKIHDARFSPNGRYIAFRTIAGQLSIVNCETGDILLPPTMHGHGILQYDFSSESNYLISLDRNGVLRQWQLPKQNSHTPHYELPSAIKDAWSIPNQNQIFTLSSNNTLTKFAVRNDGISLEMSVKLDFPVSCIAQASSYGVALARTQFAVFDGNNLFIQDQLPANASGVFIRNDQLHVQTKQGQAYVLTSFDLWTPVENGVKQDELQYSFSQANRVVKNDTPSVIQIAQPLSSVAIGNSPFMSYSLDTKNAPQVELTPTAAFQLPIKSPRTLGFVKLENEIAIINIDSVTLHSPSADLQSKAAFYLDAHSAAVHSDDASPLGSPNLSGVSTTDHLSEQARPTPPVLSGSTAASLRSPFVDPKVLDLIDEPIDGTAMRPNTPNGDELTAILPSSFKFAISNTGVEPVELDLLSVSTTEPISQKVAHVRVQSLSENSRLALTEIELYDASQSRLPIATSTCSSSTGVGRSANAMDGNKDADINRGRSTFVSQQEFHPWVEFTLESSSLISRVQLHNTSDISLRHSLRNAVVEYYNAEHDLLGSFFIDELPDPEINIDTARPPSLILSNIIQLSPGKRPAYVGLTGTDTNALRDSVVLEPHSTLVAVIKPTSARIANKVQIFTNSIQHADVLTAVSIPSAYRVQVSPYPTTVTSYFDRLRLHQLIVENDLKRAFAFADNRWRQATDLLQLQDQLFYAKSLAALGILVNEPSLTFHSQLVETLTSEHSTNAKLLLLPFLTASSLPSLQGTVTIQPLLEDTTASVSARLLGLATLGFLTEEHSKNVRLIRNPATAPAPKSVLTALIQTIILRSMNHESVEGADAILANLKLYIHNHNNQLSNYRDPDWPYHILLTRLFSTVEPSPDSPDRPTTPTP